MQEVVSNQQMVNDFTKRAPLYGLVSIYLFSRRGAQGLFDLSQAKVCGYRTLSWYFVGVSLA